MKKRIAREHGRKRGITASTYIRFFFPFPPLLYSFFFLFFPFFFFFFLSFFFFFLNFHSFRVSFRFRSGIRKLRWNLFGGKGEKGEGIRESNKWKLKIEKNQRKHCSSLFLQRFFFFFFFFFFLCQRRERRFSPKSLHFYRYMR